tara:strand:- start:129 stop:1022 length:894 start_codon:yes stop_codon:yes gene_type:complete
MTREVSLVLGSGAAKGLAHIGVIRCLEEHDYKIKYIAGSSMGALIGGIYAAGNLDIYTKWVRELKRNDVIRLLDLSFSKKSIFKGDRIIEVLKDMIGDHDIENLPIGFTAVATDLTDQKEIWFTRGSLFKAIRASIAMPMLFSPVVISGKTIVDGGIINPLPIAPTLNNSTELTIAVSLNGAPEKYTQPNKTELEDNTESDNTSSYRLAIDKFINNLLPKNIHSSDEELNAFNVVSQSIDILQTSVTRFKLAAYHPDIVIEVPRNICSKLEFDRAEELINFGYNRATEKLKSLDSLS